MNAPRTIFALTGDFNERSDEPEFSKAEEFLKGLYGIEAFGHQIRPSDIFMIPGNHDLKYGEDSMFARWARFVRFYQDHNDLRQGHSEPLDARDPRALTRIVDQSEEGLVVAEINSCAYVEKGTVDERRGQLDDDAVNDLEVQLKKIPPAKLQRSVRIALIHHHPVVLPVLYEEDKEYDAVLNSELLLGLLERIQLSSSPTRPQTHSLHLQL